MHLKYLRYMLLSLSILGIFLSLILLYFNARKYRSSLYLGLFFFLISLYGLYQYILLFSKSVTLISLFLYNVSIVVSPIYLIGPMLYWYVRSVLTDQSKLKRSDLWHFLPAIIFFIAALPNAFVPWDEKVEVARTVINDKGYILVYQATLLSKIFPKVVIFISRFALVLGYTLWSLAMFINYLQKRKASTVFSTQQFMKKWLFLLLGFLLVLVVSQIFLLIKSFEMHLSELFFTLSIVRVISGAGLIGLLISPFFFPAILYGLPRMPEINEQKNDLQENEKRKTTVSLESEYLNSIGQRTESYMKEFQPFLQPDFNLTQLSAQIHIPVHHLGYFFREKQKQTFTDYRNRWRTNYAKNLINEGKASELTIEAIGLNSGFPNRNAFLNAFKKFEGNTPSNFLQPNSQD